MARKKLTQKYQAIVLTFTATLPFLIGALMLWLDYRPLFLPGSWQLLVHSYAVAAGCFICGIQWGHHMQGKVRLNFFPITTFLAAVLWCSMLLAGTDSGLLLIAAVFFLLWLVDFILYSRKAMADWFFGVRTLSTLIVLGALLFIILD